VLMFLTFLNYPSNKLSQIWGKIVLTQCALLKPKQGKWRWQFQSLRFNLIIPNQFRDGCKWYYHWSTSKFIGPMAFKTITTFIISTFMQFILKFRDWYKNHCSMLVVLSTIKFTFSPGYGSSFSFSINLSTD